MLRLLHKSTRSGYPSDYVLSRLRGRLDTVASGRDEPWEAGAAMQANDEQIWDAAAGERRWLYLQMDNTLRSTLAPLLLYFELNTLVSCLRTLEPGLHDSPVVDLDTSLLAEELKEIARTMSFLPDVYVKLERYLSQTALAVDGLAEAYGAGGVQQCEELLRRKFLAQVEVFANNTAIVDFFRRIIDLKNAMIMAKCLRWKKKKIPPLVRGGNVPVTRSWAVAPEAGVRKIVRRYVRGNEISEGGVHPVKLEALLCDSISVAAARQLRSSCPVTSIAGYVWLVSSAAQRRSHAFHAARFTGHFPGQTGLMQ